MGVPDTTDEGRQRSAAPSAVAYGDYWLLHRVAIGGMAELFLAQCRKPSLQPPTEPVALKRILPHMAEDPEFRRMFIDEARIASHLDHPNVVPIRRLGTVGESLFIAMAFVWGKDLLQVINRFRRNGRRVPAGLAAYVAYNMCGALAYAHDKLDARGRPLHLVHRDVSPQNVLVGYDGSVKLIDFGIARAASRTTRTQTGVLKGKFGYMSPEQVRGMPIDHRSDLFAVGTCLWEMLTSERLFAGESDFATLERVRNADVEPPSAHAPSVPRDLEAIVMRALHCDRDRRYQSARELRLALQSFLQSEPVPFDVSRLSTWMHHLFAEELEAERLLTAAFVHDPATPPRASTTRARAARESQPVVFRRPSGAPVPRAAASGGGAVGRSAPVADESPFDDLADEPTHIYQAGELEQLSAEPPAPAVGPASLRWDAPPPPRGASVPPPLPTGRAPSEAPGAAAADGDGGPLPLRFPGAAWLRRAGWLASAERRWLLGAGLAAALLVAAMVAAILGT